MSRNNVPIVQMIEVLRTFLTDLSILKVANHSRLVVIWESIFLTLRMVHEGLHFFVKNVRDLYSFFRVTRSCATLELIFLINIFDYFFSKVKIKQIAYFVKTWNKSKVHLSNFLKTLNSLTRERRKEFAEINKH